MTKRMVVQLASSCEMITNECDRKEATLTAAINALLVSINPEIAKGDHLSRQIAAALHAMATRSTQLVCTLSLGRNLYNGVTGLLDRTSKLGIDIPVGSTALDDMKKLLLQGDIDIETVRLCRANAVVAFSKASPAAFGTLRLYVNALAACEASPEVQNRLKSALEG